MGLGRTTAGAGSAGAAAVDAKVRLGRRHWLVCVCGAYQDRCRHLAKASSVSYTDAVSIVMDGFGCVQSRPGVSCPPGRFLYARLSILLMTSSQLSPSALTTKNMPFDMSPTVIFLRYVMPSRLANILVSNIVFGTEALIFCISRKDRLVTLPAFLCESVTLYSSLD